MVHVISELVPACFELHFIFRNICLLALVERALQPSERKEELLHQQNGFAQPPTMLLRFLLRRTEAWLRGLRAVALLADAPVGAAQLLLQTLNFEAHFLILEMQRTCRWRQRPGFVER